MADNTNTPGVEAPKEGDIKSFNVLVTTAWRIHYVDFFSIF